MILVIVLMTITMPMEEVTVSVPMTFELAEKIKQPKKQQRTSSDAREPGADGFTQSNAKPRDQQAKQRREKSVAAAGQRGHAQGPRAIPTLRARSEDKRQPMSRDGGVKECDRESRNRDRSENSLVHKRRPKAAAYRERQRQRLHRNDQSGIRPEHGLMDYRAAGIRTRDLLHPRQALYQAEPQPELT